jgi:hypothetical protein
VIILEINEKRTIEYLKTMLLPETLKEGRGRLGVGQASYS